MDIKRVTSIDKVRGIRHKQSYWLCWTRFIPNGKTEGMIGDNMKIDGMHFLTLDRKAIKAKIAEYVSKMLVGDDIDLYVDFGFGTSEQLMTITKQETGVMVIDDSKPGLHWEEYQP